MNTLEYDGWYRCRSNVSSVRAFWETSDRKGREPQIYRNRYTYTDISCEHTLLCMRLKLPVCMNMLGTVLKTNSLISLYLSVWMCLFFISLTSFPLEPCYLWGVFMTLLAVFSLSLYLGSVFFIFSPPTFPSLYSVIFSLYHSVLLLSPLSFSSFTPSVSLTAAAK